MDITHGVNDSQRALPRHVQAALAGRLRVLIYRTTSGNEVDLVIEAEGHQLPIEVKTSSRPRLRDAAGLVAFRAEYGKQALPGLLLHAGSATEWPAPDLLATPWWRVL